MKKYILFFCMTMLALTGCVKNQERITKISVMYGAAREEHITDPETIEKFRNAVNGSIKMGQDKVIATKPPVSFRMLTETGKTEGYHLWVTDGKEGYLQSLSPGQTATFKLTQNGVDMFRTYIKEYETTAVLKQIEFEK